MAKLAASSRLSLSDPRRSALDVSWTFSLRRAPGSDGPGRPAGEVLETLAHGSAATRVAEAVAVACGYVLAYGRARRFRVTLGVDGARCSVCVTDTGYHRPPGGLAGVPPRPPSPDGPTLLCRALTGTGTGEPLDGVRVHHTADGAVLVRFRARLPEPDGPGRPHRPSPDAPDHSRGPGARG
ncbi:hypothetical protein ABZZ36_07700 [Actinacidiphila glaucinigra]|uniref:hypothetical protein n=1 Tax=Actinacidiphila glaucinigra TaxID=235986 RepID=UPI0033A859C3